MRSPADLKGVQQLTGRMAALSRFLPQAARKALPWYQLLKKGTTFHWDQNCEASFLALKEYLASPPVLSSPLQGESLFIYLSVGNSALSSVLVRDEGKDEFPIYFVSRALQGPELQYSKVEKFAFCLILAARRLRQYFQSHPIVVRTAQPIKQVLQKLDLAGRMMAWAIELSEFDISYEPRRAIKSQALADFVSEFTDPHQSSSSDTWVIYVDGSSNQKGAGAGVILENPDGLSIEYSLKFEFLTSNNQAEYEAVLAGLRMAKELGAVEVQILSDSQLVVSQVIGDYQAKEPILQKYLDKVKTLAQDFAKFSITHIPRCSNSRADVLSKLASTKGAGNNRSLIQEQISDPSVIMAIAVSPNWMHSIRAYLEHGILPADQKEARKLTRKAAEYVIIDGILYRRGMSSPLLRCLTSEEAQETLNEVHGGMGSHHVGGKSLARKILRAGYFWPTLVSDSIDHVRMCPQCQFFSDLYQKPAEELHSLASPWPFSMWGMDIVGQFPTAPGQLRFIVVAVDYFTKWIEAEPLATITSARIQKFFLRQVISRFGFPLTLITDNGSQFAANNFQLLAENLGISHRFSSVEHPQTNGQAEAANRAIVDGLKKRIIQAKGAWADLLPEVLWSIRTTVQTSTGETPFRLTYGCDAVIPIERRIHTFRMRDRPEKENENLIKEDLVLAEEIREAASVREKKAKERQAKQYNKSVQPRSFEVGDLVLRRADIGLKNRRDGKFAQNWEGPYRVVSKTHSGAYRLETLEGVELKNSWNVAKLRTYFS